MPQHIMRHHILSLDSTWKETHSFKFNLYKRQLKVPSPKIRDSYINWNKHSPNEQE